jgi:hypothetical protein
MYYVLVSGFILFLAVREHDRKHKAERGADDSKLHSPAAIAARRPYEWNSGGRITDANSMFLNSLTILRDRCQWTKLPFDS